MKPSGASSGNPASDFLLVRPRASAHRAPTPAINPKELASWSEGASSHPPRFTSVHFRLSGHLIVALFYS